MPYQPNADNLSFVEELYQAYCQDSQAIDAEWRDYFESDGWNELRGQRLRPSFRAHSIFNPPVGNGAAAPAAVPGGIADAFRQERVDQLIRAYRVRGHRAARLDPLGRTPPPFPELQLEHYGLGEEDLDLRFSAQCMGLGVRTLREILEVLRNTYSGHIGVQYMHIDDPEPKFWLQEKMEWSQNIRHLSREEQIRILTRLTDAEIFEEFVSKKFVGAKRFGLEGAESLIPLLDMALESAGEFQVDDVVIGMAHRGRLNVLANIMQKAPSLVFHEFQDPQPEQHFGRDDVKYHLGYASEWQTSTGKKIHLSLCFNPSHLEFVGPVVLGRVRARQDRRGKDFTHHMALLIHGDAAFAGQGVVQEMLNLSEIPGFRTGGTIHVVLNNQIGFTTGPRQARSTTYCTDVAKMLQIPVLHVNGEHPEAVAQAIWLAMQYREAFHKDVVIDMYCYRRHGHNEGDDPTFTQPVLYREIQKRKSVRESYIDNLVALGGLSREEAEQIAVERRKRLEEELDEARRPDFDYRTPSEGGLWKNFRGGRDASVPTVATQVARPTLAELLYRLAEVPEDFTPHPKVPRMLLEARREMAEGKRPLDWGTAENLAYASLLVEGHPVRLTGQDVTRGTFSHRHAVLHDYQTGEPYIPLSQLREDQARFQIWDSPLSETAVLGFEFGFSLDSPNSLVIWEAQFGDFVNVAQVIIDQFISSSEDKWNRLNHLVMLLPHGFEGQGPEHSSARLERFLEIAADDNIQVVNLTTPAQLFHCLRRQIHRPWRKPLVVMSPKSLLRHPEVVSDLDEFARGSFRRVLADKAGGDPDKVDRILLCSGKIYYELERFRQEHERHDVAIVRVELLYPFPDQQLKTALTAYPRGTPVIWVQEEPANMGALRSIQLRFGDRFYGRFPFLHVSRPESSSPATGSAGSHKIEQAGLIELAFNMGVPQV
ncbi:MAG: 2-oxoglutarate dehydrogenase E1 component [Armatimonadetes bacterium]|nr:2-oxoglutarate dehydrogenase E1 component [Armatimonadota bacterium]